MADLKKLFKDKPWKNLTEKLKNLSPEKIRKLIASLKNDNKNYLIQFGSYWQGKTEYEGKTPILWRVLSMDENYCLLLSEYALDAREYHVKQVNTNWKDCSLRQWLNNDFLRNAFSEKERERIGTAHIKGKTLYEHDWPAKDTRDKIFLLSRKDMSRYFEDASDRQCKPTAYALTQGAPMDNIQAETCCWWLRSMDGPSIPEPTDGTDEAAFVQGDGHIGYKIPQGMYGASSGAYVSRRFAIRPALFIKRFSESVPNKGSSPRNH